MHKSLAGLLMGLSTLSLSAPAQAQDSSQPLDRFVQLDLEVPFRPTVFPSGDSRYVTYELNLTNQIPRDLTLRRIDVLDSDSRKVLESDSGSALRKRVRITGQREFDATGDEPVSLGAGQRAIVFFFVKIPSSGVVPQRLSHRLWVGTEEGERAFDFARVTSVDASELPVLDPPLAGGPWLCDGAPAVDSYHRRTLLCLDGVGRVSQRYAIDYEIKTPEGKTFQGDAKVNTNYPAYGQPIYAAAAGRVVKVVEGLPDNEPPQVPPLTDPDKAGGNSVVLDIGSGRYLICGHMQPGSIRVKVGDSVTAGQLLGKVGNSGNSFEPHLHVQVCDRPSFLGAQGLPYVLRQYQLVDGASKTPIQGQLPLLNQLIEFPARQP